MRDFRRDQNGFILVLALIVMPVFIGFGLVIIDLGRGNNAHADLSAAADALALAGARELDGGPDAIPRAKSAMANLTNSVSMLARSGPGMEITLVYADTSGNEFTPVFLTDIPALDTDPIDAAWITNNSTTDSTEATYVYVHAQSQNLDSGFFNPANLLRQSVPIAAVAVAKSVAAVCDIPPLYICNPFEFDGSGNYVGDQLQSAFAAGGLHGRLFRLHPPGNNTQAPGNFGFLSVNGSSSAAALTDIFAGNTNPTCYESDVVRTKPGGANGISQGINTRFDIYKGQFSNWNNNTKPFVIAPAENVRKGSKPNVNPGNGNMNDCVANSANSADIYDDHTWDPVNGWNPDGVDDNVYGFPDNAVMLPPNQGIAGAHMGSNSTWAAQTYLDENYLIPLGAVGTPTVTTDNATSDIPSSFDGHLPSRYDVYRYEIANNLHTVRAPGDQISGNNTGETGAPNCGTSKSPSINPIADPDRRLMVAAIIDCTTVGTGGGVNYIPVNSYASIFMARPMLKIPGTSPPQDSTIDVEIIDITGFGGNGTLDTFIREESILVR